MDFNTVSIQAQALPTIDGVSMGDVLALPLDLRTFLLRVIQKRGLETSSVAQLLETTNDNAAELCGLLTERGWIEPRKRSNSQQTRYRLNFAEAHGREQFRDMWEDNF